MKQLLIVSTEHTPFTGGIGRYSTEITAGAHNIGLNVWVVAPSHGIAVSEVGVSRFLTSGDFSPRDILRAACCVVGAYFRTRPEVVHATDYRALAIARFALPFVRGGRFIVTCHGTELKGAGRVKNLFQRVLMRAVRVVANSEYTAGLFSQRTGRVIGAVTPLGVRGEAFAPGVDQKECRRLLGFDDSDYIVLCVARFESRKAQDVLVDSLAHIAGEVAERLRVVFVGPANGAYADAVYAAGAGSSAQVSFLGAVGEDVLRLAYGASDVFCLLGRPHPARAEGFGLVYLEAASQGLPTIAARVDAIPEVVQDGVTGILVPPDDPAAVASAITTFFGDPGLRERMGRSAKAWSEMFNWEDTASLTYRPDSGLRGGR